MASVAYNEAFVYDTRALARAVATKSRFFFNLQGNLLRQSELKKIVRWMSTYRVLHSSYVREKKGKNNRATTNTVETIYYFDAQSSRINFLPVRYSHALFYIDALCLTSLSSNASLLSDTRIRSRY